MQPHGPLVRHKVILPRKPAGYLDAARVLQPALLAQGGAFS